MKKGSKSFEIYEMLQDLGSEIEEVHNKGNEGRYRIGKGFYGRYGKEWKFIGYSKTTIRIKFIEGLIS